MENGKKLQQAGGAGPEEYTHGGVKKTKFEPKVPSTTTRRLKKLATPAPLATPLATGGQSDEAVPRELQRLLQQVDSSDRPHHQQRPTTSKVAFGFTASKSTSSGLGRERKQAAAPVARKQEEFLQADQDQSKVLKTSKSEGLGKSKSEGFENSKRQGFELFKSEDGFDREKSFKSEERFDHDKYFPVTLPLQKPGEEPRLFDDDDEEEEDESGAGAAEELGLVDDSDALFFFQFPKGLPVLSGKAAAARLEELAGKGGGAMGKLVVYESGAVKLRVGEVVLDALPGTECAFAQEVAAVNVAARRCAFVGEVQKRVVLTPDVADHVLPNLRSSTKP